MDPAAFSGLQGMPNMGGVNGMPMMGGGTLNPLGQHAFAHLGQTRSQVQDGGGAGQGPMVSGGWGGYGA